MMILIVSYLDERMRSTFLISYRSYFVDIFLILLHPPSFVNLSPVINIYPPKTLPFNIFLSSLSMTTVAISIRGCFYAFVLREIVHVDSA